MRSPESERILAQVKDPVWAERVMRTLDRIQADATLLPEGCPEPWRSWLLYVVRSIWRLRDGDERWPLIPEETLSQWPGPVPEEVDAAFRERAERKRLEARELELTEALRWWVRWAESKADWRAWDYDNAKQRYAQACVLLEKEEERE